jgi:hypothetical protein
MPKKRFAAVVIGAGLLSLAGAAWAATSPPLDAKSTYDNGPVARRAVIKLEVRQTAGPPSRPIHGKPIGGIHPNGAPSAGPAARLDTAGLSGSAVSGGVGMAALTPEQRLEGSLKEIARDLR